MPTQQEKINVIRAYARDLQDFASEFNKGVIVANQLPDHVVDFLYAISVETNRLHNELSERFESQQKEIGE